MSVGLAYLCGEYPRATDVFIQREVSGLRQAGIQVETISVRRPKESEQGGPEQNDERRRTHYLLPSSPWRLIGTHLGWLFCNPVRYIRALLLAVRVRSPGVNALMYQLFYFAEAGLLAAHMRRLRLSHVHNHAPDSSGYVVMIAREMAGITYSMTLHGHGIFSEARRWRLKEKIERALFVICISNHGCSQAMYWVDRRYWDRIHVVRCGIDTSAITTRTHSGRGRNVLFVGRLDHVKGLPLLIEAFSGLAHRDPAVHLHIVGDGPDRANLESMVSSKDLMDRVTFYGYRSQEQLRGHFANADVFAMSSLVEGIPVVLMEAMAHGVPVVAPWISGIPELVRDGDSGFLVMPGDPDALRRRIEKVLADPACRAHYGAAGRRIVQSEFELTDQSRRLAELMSAYLDGVGE